ncbi:hypothetical protein KEM48_011883 [Puccinia striiformis f. sp. tritici PST-130]|nr:hypothetical protein KEM48_011883 [Puccinia striiformis f. sp. tritici PST-130]
MSVPFSTYQPAPTHLTVDRHGLLIVAGAASRLHSKYLCDFKRPDADLPKQNKAFSFRNFIPPTICNCLVNSLQTKARCTWASARLVFMQTSFGPIFLNLVFADMLLAIGLMHNFINFNERGAVTASITCTSQGVLIQLADVASALLNLLIAIETFIILSNGPMLSCLELHSFYNWNGAWCWISPDYLTYQITFHIISLIENYRRSTLSPVVALVLSTLFALRGAIDVLAFGMTRNVFILRTPAAPAYDEEQLTPTSPHSIQKPRQISLDLDKLEDLKDSSRDPLDPRFEPQTVDLKLSLN